MPSETFVTDTIHDTLAKDKVPWMSWGWFKSEYTDPYMFPCHANGMREASNVAKWISNNSKPQSVGILYLSQFRAGLIDARRESLLVQGEIISAAISETQATPMPTVSPVKMWGSDAGK